MIIVHDNIPIITDIFLRTNEKEALANYSSSIQSGENDATNVIRRYSLQLKQALGDYEGKYGTKINNIKVISNLNNIEELIPAFKKIYLLQDYKFLILLMKLVFQNIIKKKQI